ncbi:hypothetical protein [Aureliella helgolandensis]|uniref:Uncharacterized protein n=1 Tax=Aureliella helgolandensis TaxID=2527968 RepID=A0A518G015_9BACT|nr:hypothetical protein [Aureliella helgolandensis]QDV21931.1 hypothetical protein Q31a_02100 [Aureliella helgolandensis]
MPKYDASSQSETPPRQFGGFASGIGRIVMTSLCSCVALLAGVWYGQKTPVTPLPPLLASASSSSDTMAMATGAVSEDAEGVFFLDFITGDLQCLVYYPRSGTFGAHFATNVTGNLGGGGKNSKYMMVTGQAVTKATSGGARPGASLVYVTDSTNGTFAAYAIPWNRTAESSNRPQTGALVYVGGGPIRNYQLNAAGQNQPAAIVDPNQK